MLNLTLHPMKKNKWEILCTMEYKARCSHVSSLLAFLYFAHLSSCPLCCHPDSMEQQLLVVLTEAFGASSAANPHQRIPVTAVDSVWKWGRRCVPVSTWETRREMLPGHFGSILAASDIPFYWTSVKVLIVLFCPLSHSLFCINFFFHLSPLPFFYYCIIFLYYILIFVFSCGPLELSDPSDRYSLPCSAEEEKLYPN